MKTLKYEEVYRQEYRDLADARASVSVTVGMARCGSGQLSLRTEAGPEWAAARSAGLAGSTEAAVRIPATACVAGTG